MSFLLTLADNTDFEGLSPYDMADMLKQYFRELPEPILTSKLAETFISIFSSTYGWLMWMSVSEKLKKPFCQLAYIV